MTEISTQLYRVVAVIEVEIREESPEAAKEAVASGWPRHGLPHAMEVRRVVPTLVKAVAG